MFGQARIMAVLGNPQESLRLLREALGGQGQDLHTEADFAAMASDPAFRLFVKPRADGGHGRATTVRPTTCRDFAKCRGGASAPRPARFSVRPTTSLDTATGWRRKHARRLDGLRVAFPGGSRARAQCRAPVAITRD
jgi:hypothetical protein